MYDPEVSHILQVIGNMLSSHVFARASMSRGIGRAEETLTADLRDLAEHFDVGRLYLSHVSSKSQVYLGAKDITKHKEAKIGADFVLAIDGLDSNGRERREIRKVLLVQAKRQNFGKKSYAKSSNHIKHAKHMAKASGLANAFFAFYHDDSIRRFTPRLIGWSKPKSPPYCLFDWPPHGPDYFYAKHPKLGGPAFIEPSSYRTLYMKLRNPPSRAMPPLSSWGIAMLGADYFVHESGRQRRGRGKLPPVPTVLKEGATLEEFLVQAVDCEKGTNMSANAFLKALQVAEKGHPGFTPRFTVGVAFASLAREVSYETMPDWRPLIPWLKPRLE
jgi:hypothetical protein